MLTISRRAANDLDLRAMTQGRGALGRNLATISVPAGIVVFGIAYAFSRSWWIAVAAGVGLFAISLYSNLIFFRKVRRGELLRTQSRAVEVLEVSADRVLNVEPVGDNAPAYCFFVGERKALLLVGQWLLKYESFPSKTFRLHLWSETKVPIRIDETGPTVLPEHSDVQLRTAYRILQFELIDASPETLQADLDSALGSARSRASAYLA
jgi:hypothetical protein